MVNASRIVDSLAAAGSVEGTVPVKVGPRFLELFSENLYSSPSKAFEELAANSWDAGATIVHVGMPENPSDDESVLWVLDNGESMDFDGLAALWRVAESRKRERTDAPRAPIGKFGIGKLATYILANEVTYVCRDQGGSIRSVTMDYRSFAGDDLAGGDGPTPDPDTSGLSVTTPLLLPVRNLTLDEVLSSVAIIHLTHLNLRSSIAARTGADDGRQAFLHGRTEHEHRRVLEVLGGSALAGWDRMSWLRDA